MKNLIIGIVSIIIGIVIAIVNSGHNSHVAPLMQETQLLLGYIWASIFVIGGVIILLQKKNN